jgi:hypothetical protein
MPAIRVKAGAVKAEEQPQHEPEENERVHQVGCSFLEGLKTRVHGFEEILRTVGKALHGLLVRARRPAPVA